MFLFYGTRRTFVIQKIVSEHLTSEEKFKWACCLHERNGILHLRMAIGLSKLYVSKHTI